MRTLVHAFEPASRANGPGLRSVIWFQGCTLGCPGCFNPQTHSGDGGYETDTAVLAESVLQAAVHMGTTGVTLSGGEPLQQPAALLDLLGRLEGSGLGIVLFSGYTRGEIERQPRGPATLGRVDALIAGRYAQSRHKGTGMLGSANQLIHLLTARYEATDFRAVPASEIILHRDGSFTITGITPRSLTGTQGR